MSERVTIVMEPRDKTSKEENGRLRRQGFTPCVFYGPELKEAVSGKLNTATLEKILCSGSWETTRLNVQVPSGEEEMCLIRELQRHPLTGKLVHVDLMRLLKGHKITVNVPIHIHGREQCQGLKDGGVLDHIRDVEIETTPVNIPDSIIVDISALNLGDSIHLRDLNFGENVELLSDPDEVAAIILIPRSVDETALEETEEKEVEVLAKGKAAKAEAEE